MNNNSSLMGNFQKALNYYISVAGKTKKEVADGIGVPPTTFSSWSNGKHLPDMEKLQLLADYLHAPIEHFFNFDLIVVTPDPLLKDVTETFSCLNNEDKLLVRALADRLHQLTKE